MPDSYTIGRFATAAGVHVETVRYYQRRGLIPEPLRPQGGIRRYSNEDVARLRFIKRAQAVGFTLAEVEALLKLWAARSCRATRELAAVKLDFVDARIRELRGLRRELAQWVAECDANREESMCPVIDHLASSHSLADRLAAQTERGRVAGRAIEGRR